MVVGVDAEHVGGLVCHGCSGPTSLAPREARRIGLGVSKRDGNTKMSLPGGSTWKKYARGGAVGGTRGPGTRCRIKLRRTRVRLSLCRRLLHVAGVPQSGASGPPDQRRADGEGAAAPPQCSRRCRVKQRNLVRHSGRRPPWLETMLGLGHKAQRALIRSVAVATMLAMYAAASIGSAATTTIGVAGLSGLALTATATPASARRRWRRGGYWRGGYYRRRRPYYRRGYYGGWGYPYRRRRRRGFNLFLNF